MIDYTLLIPLFAGFLLTLFLMPYWIRKAAQIGLMWDDMNKFSLPKVAGSGGIIAVLGFIFASLLFVAYRVFYLNNLDHLIEIFSLLLTITLIAGIGFVDDILGWQRGGLSRRSRMIMIAIVSIPLVVINVGATEVSIPLYGPINLGLLYLLIIPIGIVGASTVFNFLAGLNGLEAGQGILILSSAAIVSYYTGNPWLSVICLAMILPLLAFLMYNFSPAKVFPGNSITLSIGALFAIISILGNFEKVAVFFFIPYILEFFLKSRGKLIKHSFGKPDENNHLTLRYDKIYGTTHLAIFLLNKFGIKATEKKVVISIWCYQAIIIALGLYIFRAGIFL